MDGLLKFDVRKTKKKKKKKKKMTIMMMKKKMKWNSVFIFDVQYHGLFDFYNCFYYGYD